MTRDAGRLPPLDDLDARREQVRSSGQAGPTVATRDHDEVRRWAAQWRAEPATGVGVRDINDGGTELRFSFPGVGLLRPLTWDEWFAIFDAQGLVLVYVETREARGGQAPQYRLIPQTELDTRVGAATGLE